VLHWSAVAAIIGGASVTIFMMLASAIAQAETNTRFLALGDSYTIGEGVADNDRWPAQLAHALRRDFRIDAPEIIARTGWTTDELADAMQRHTFHPPYALVTLLIGVNNQYRGRDLQNYRDQFRALLARAIELADGKPQRVIVVSIPDWGVTKFGHDSGRDVAQIACELDAYNAANAQITASLGALYVDITGISRDGGSAADSLVADGLHPSSALYRRWTEAILPVATKALR
jgi:lysophospholipase L1-like esterase